MNRQKRDIYNSAKRYADALKQFKNNPAISERNKKLVRGLLEDAMLGKTTIGKQKKKAGYRTCLRYLHNLKTFIFFIKKDLDKVTKKDIISFASRLEKDTLRKKDGKPYSAQTKRDFNIILKKFYKWHKGNNKFYPDLVSWLDTSYVPGSYTALTEKQIEKVIKNIEIPLDKTFMNVLFDLGARIEEFLNIQFEDITKTEKGYKICIHFSKTYSRTLPLDGSIPHLKEWLALHPKNTPYVFPLSYGQCKNRLEKYGKQAIGMKIIPQIIRHSKATQLAQAGVGRYQMCEWMGWSMSSKMPDRYIRREGIDNEKTLEEIKRKRK